VLCWISGSGRPSLPSMLQLSYKLGISIRALLQQTPEGEEHRSFWNRPKTPKRPVANYQSASQIRAQLDSALAEACPRSVADVAASMGYESPERLYQADRSKCKQIAKRFRESGLSHEWKRRDAERIAPLEVIERRLETSLISDNPESAHKIAKDLGYANAGYIWIQFPEKCRAIAAKLEAQRLHQFETFKSALHTALQSPTPVTLEIVRKDLGLSSSSVLRSHFPELCDRLIERCKALNRSGRATRAISIASEVISGFDGQLSGAELNRRTGGSRWMLEQYAPDLLSDVKESCRRNHEIERQAGMARLDTDCLIIALCLHVAGQVPTYGRVEELLPSDSIPSWTATRCAWQRARDRMSLLPPFRIR
jgi:methylphosphotriester-DNA--protein-cysteine methyltransferase